MTYTLSFSRRNARTGTHSLWTSFALALLVIGLFTSWRPFAPVTRGATNPTIVIYAATGAVSGSRWTVIDDALAAGGSAIFNADQAEARLATPFAAPASYVELTFTAPAQVDYHLWLRMKAHGDAGANDSVYAQFSDALDSSGAAAFRIGTTDAMAVILEEGRNAGVSGWGWADNGYGGLGVNLKFASTGTHKLRLQQREDGVAIDQVVLSPSTYLSVPPGPATKDTTILPPNDGSDSPLPPAVSSGSSGRNEVPPPLAASSGNSGRYKVATWNIRSGHGRCPISGSCRFTDSIQNCTDTSRALNAWGHGIPQQELTRLNQDPSVIAIGLQEAWVCGQPSNVKSVLHWVYSSPSYNGTGLVARFGIRGSLETKLVSAPSDGPAYVIGADICVDSACSATVRVYVAHLQYTADDPHVTDGVMLAQARTMLGWIATRPHSAKHVLTGDLNAFEREPQIDFGCELTFDFRAPRLIRNSGYTDAWMAMHGTTPGMTATLNRNGCGVTNGGPWKRIDYGYLKGLTPASSSHFGVVPVNTAAPSDHYGLITGFNGTPDPVSSRPPSGGGIVLPAGEILLRAADDAQPRLVGRWAITSDSTADGGRRWTNADQGNAKVATPLAAPRSYFEVKFTAPANTSFHIWLRMRAQNDSYANDSVWVQFSDSLNSANAAAYRIGTTGGLPIILENGIGAGVAGWGWGDDGFSTLGKTVRFATSGTHTIRIQQREDGVSIDQILLSPKKYLTTAPGAAKNDTTLYAATQKPR
jgi:hypothetical protein